MPTSSTSPPAARRFCLVLVKPSHYDDDGYVIQWLRSAIPSNSLAALYGLARDCAERKVLGEDVEFEMHAFDETNTRIRPESLARLIEKAGAGHGHAGRRAIEPVPARARHRQAAARAGIQVAIGGFHVSGTIAMLRRHRPELERAKRWASPCLPARPKGGSTKCLRDACAGALKPLYNFMNDLPGIEDAPVPLIAGTRASRTVGAVTSFDAGRGCPFQCSFCTIINVQGRKSRRRSPDDVERIVRENIAQGLHSFFITDDNFARNRDWEPIFDRLIRLREDREASR